jgi:hypothetical protein
MVEAAVNTEADNADQQLAENSFDVTEEINEDAPVVERYNMQEYGVNVHDTFIIMHLS